MRCARCHRPTLHPVTLGGMPFGAHCASLVRGPQPKRLPSLFDKAPPKPDPRQRDLFAATA